MNIKFVAGLLIGAAAGAAIIHFLNTEEGKAFTEKLKKDVSEAEDELSVLAEDLIQKGKDFMNDLNSKANPTTVS